MQSEVAVATESGPITVGQKPCSRFAAEGQRLILRYMDIHLFAPAPVDPYEDLMRTSRHFEAPRRTWTKVADHGIVDHYFEHSQMLGEPAGNTLHFESSHRACVKGPKWRHFRIGS